MGADASPMPAPQAPEEHKVNYDTWKCAKCTFENRAITDRCEMCGERNPQISGAAQGQVASCPRPWCGSQNTLNHDWTGQCKTCGTYFWKCAGFATQQQSGECCGLINYTTDNHPTVEGMPKECSEDGERAIYCSCGLSLAYSK